MLLRWFKVFLQSIEVISLLIQYLEVGGTEVILVKKVDLFDVCELIVDLVDGRGFDVEILGITVSSEIG